MKCRMFANRYIEYHKANPCETSFDFNFYTHWIGYAFWQVGKKKEAEYILIRKSNIVKEV